MLEVDELTNVIELRLVFVNADQEWVDSDVVPFLETLFKDQQLMILASEDITPQVVEITEEFASGLDQADHL